MLSKWTELNLTIKIEENDLLVHLSIYVGYNDVYIVQLLSQNDQKVLFKKE